MLETIRQYAHERLEARDDRQLIARRHADYVMALAEEADVRLMRSGGRVLEERLEAELGDIRLALGWAREHDVDLGLRLAASLTLFWMGHNLLEEGRRWCTELLALGEDASDYARAKAIMAVAVFAGISGDHAEGELLHERARAFSQGRRPLRHCVVAPRSCPESHGDRPAGARPPVPRGSAADPS